MEEWRLIYNEVVGKKLFSKYSILCLAAQGPEMERQQQGKTTDLKDPVDASLHLYETARRSVFPWVTIKRENRYL